jgi:hypothetical protein
VLPSGDSEGVSFPLSEVEEPAGVPNRSHPVRVRVAAIMKITRKILTNFFMFFII